MEDKDEKEELLEKIEEAGQPVVDEVEGLMAEIKKEGKPIKIVSPDGGIFIYSPKLGEIFTAIKNGTMKNKDTYNLVWDLIAEEVGSIGAPVKPKNKGGN